MSEKLRWYWQNPTQSKAEMANGAKDIAIRCSSGRAFYVVRSDMWEKHERDFWTMKMPLGDLVMETWKSLKEKLLAYQEQRDACIVFNGPLVFRAEKEACFIYFWLEAQISHKERTWNGGTLHSAHNRNNLGLKNWSEDEKPLLEGIRYMVPNSVWPVLEPTDKIALEFEYWTKHYRRAGEEGPGYIKAMCKQIKEVAKFCQDHDDLIAWAMLLNDQGNMDSARSTFEHVINPEKDPQYLSAIQEAWGICLLAKLAPNEGVGQTRQNTPAEFHKWLLTYIHDRDRELCLPLCIANGIKTCTVNQFRNMHPGVKNGYIAQLVEYAQEELKKKGWWPPQYRLD